MTECAPTHETAEDHALLAESAAPVKFARAAAIEVARELLTHVSPCAERVLIAGSLRRRKAMVGDVELLFIPRMKEGFRGDLLAPPPMVSMVDEALEQLIAEGIIARRLSVKGTASWGAKNKLAVHVESGIPVDLFAATAANWWNYVVCRTGGSRSNIAICNAARERGWKWRPYGEGFTRVGGPDHGRVHAVASEREVFEFVGLPCLSPEERS